MKNEKVGEVVGPPSGSLEAITNSKATKWGGKRKTVKGERKGNLSGLLVAGGENQSLRPSRGTLHERKRIASGSNGGKRPGEP